MGLLGYGRWGRLVPRDRWVLVWRQGVDVTLRCVVLAFLRDSPG